MKPIEISADSWHYKLINRYTTYDRYDLKDSCAYIRAGMVCIGAMTVLTMLITAILFGYIDGVLWFVTNCQQFGLELSKWIVIEAWGIIVWGVTLTIAGLVFTMVVCIFIKEKYQDYKLSRGVTEPTAIAKLADSFHNKFCAQVEIKE